MLKTLYGKLAAGLLVLFCLVGVLYIQLTLFTTRSYLQEVNQKLNRTLAEHIVSEKILMEKGEVNEEALKEIFHMLMVINPSIEVYLLNPEGAILAFSALPGKVKRQEVSLAPIERFLRGSESYPLFGDDPRHLSRKKVFSVSPISGPTRLEGYLYVILGGEEFDSAAQRLRASYILRLSTSVAGAGLLFALLAGLLFFNILTQRLKRLTTAVERFTQSDFSETRDTDIRRPIVVSASEKGDEIDRLGITFNQMADRIQEQMLKLRETDTLRRELVANVSHDLRTPLASLQGYLETLLLKEGQLTPEEQRFYLETATKHCERLGKRVSELFELAKLDSKETQLYLEPFSLAELVQDAVQKLALSAKRKQIALNAHFPEDSPFVLADIGLIERVLENLIENALRFTTEGGKVTVALSQDKESIAVCVTDTGCGIPAEDLPYIFDRFYRVGNNRHEGSGSAGLGLAIVKRILLLHGCSIEAESTLNVGTTFTFRLPTTKPKI